MKWTYVYFYAQFFFLLLTSHSVLVILQRTFASDLKYLVLSSFCHSQHAPSSPPLVHHILSDFTTPCKKELSGHGRLPPCAHQIYVYISRGANLAPCPRMLDGNYQHSYPQGRQREVQRVYYHIFYGYTGICYPV